MRAELPENKSQTIPFVELCLLHDQQGGFERVTMEGPSYHSLAFKDACCPHLFDVVDNEKLSGPENPIPSGASLSILSKGRTKNLFTFPIHYPSLNQFFFQLNVWFRGSQKRSSRIGCMCVKAILHVIVASYIVRVNSFQNVLYH